MRANSLKTKIAAGKSILNAWCSIASALVAQAIAPQGVDSVTINRATGLIGAVHTDGSATARRHYAEGFQFCSLPTDTRLPIDAVRIAVRDARTG